MMKVTRWHYYHEHGTRYRIRATYGLDYDFARRNNQAPYFSMTADIEYQSGNHHWYDHGGGAAHEAIAAHIPEMRPYIKWHLVGSDAPMHYIANAKYFWEQATGRQPRGEYDRYDPFEAFKSTVVAGAFPGDKLDLTRRGPKEWSPRGLQPRDLLSAPWSEVERWLKDRLPDIQAAWVADMAELGVLE